jgi:hypothetical protein
MFKTAGAAAVLALGILTAAPAVQAAGNDPTAAVSAPLTKDLGVPSNPQTAPSRIISGDAARETIKLAYCYYRYVTDGWGNLYLQWYCI